jgi:allantoin racemase
MSRILIVNPNTTQSMTDKIGEAARAVASPDTEIKAMSPAMGPVSIEGYYDEAYCIPGMLAAMREGEAEGYDGFIVACADDPGVDAARVALKGPVIGIAEAAMHAATMIGQSFSIITTLSSANPVMEHLALKYGFERHCKSVRAAEFPVLALEDPASDARAMLEAEIARCVEEDRPDAIILGCAGMADLNAALTAKFGVPAIDGVAAATKMMEALLGLGLKTSKKNGYSPPRSKPYTGEFDKFAV